MNKGVFISFEGPDGCGKTTQIQLFAEYCRQQGYEVVLTREPGGTPISEKIRNIILDPENKEESPVTEALLYAASRAQHVEEKIKPALARGCVVLCDRFMDSSIAYQSYARGLGQGVIDINLFAIQGCHPDMTFFLDLNPEIGRQRQIQRGNLDRLEQEGLDFQNRVYDGYQQLIKDNPNRIHVIPADRSMDFIQEDIQRVFKDYVQKFK